MTSCTQAIRVRIEMTCVLILLVNVLGFCSLHYLFIFNKLYLNTFVETASNLMGEWDTWEFTTLRRELRGNEPALLPDFLIPKGRWVDRHELEELPGDP